MGLIYSINNVGTNNNVYFALYKIDDLLFECLKVQYDVFERSWLQDISDINAKNAFEIRANKTAEIIKKDLEKGVSGPKYIQYAGQHIVVLNARDTISNDLLYKKIPIAELVKNRVSGNGGFDFHLENEKDGVIIFGEGKYRNGINSYKASFSSALKQVVDFIKDGMDSSEYPDLSCFLSELTKNNYSSDKGYAIGFSINSSDFNGKPKNYTDILIEIQKNLNYLTLEKKKCLFIVGIIF